MHPESTAKKGQKKTKYQATMHRHEGGKGKKNWNYFSRVLQIFQISDVKVFKTALFWDHLALTKSGLKLYVISCLSVIRNV